MSEEKKNVTAEEYKLKLSTKEKEYIVSRNSVEALRTEIRTKRDELTEMTEGQIKLLSELTEMQNIYLNHVIQNQANVIKTQRETIAELKPDNDSKEVPELRKP